ncbi:MAG TPA: glycosyl hydrolase family 28-related protein [Chthonomonadales bacterium]|nr:glycosyl hydrolase family 28-related protein [Chthonomonadales bacterium]
MQERTTRRRFLRGSAVAAGAVVGAPYALAQEARSDTVGVSGAWNVAAMGAVGDGKTDCTAAFQRALDEAHAGGGGRVHVPAGMFLIEGRLRIPPHTSLVGEWEAPPVATRIPPSARIPAPPADARAAIVAGSVLLAVAGEGDEKAPPYISMERNATLKGLIVYYPKQVATPAPIPYPWTVAGIGDNISIIDCLFINPYKAVDFGSQPCGRHLIRNLYAHAIHTGLFIDKCYDVGRLENIHFWPFWMHLEPEGLEDLRRWMLRNATAFVLSRSDWQYISNSFCIGYHTGLHFRQSAPDGPGNYLLTQSGADLCDIAVHVEETQGHSGVSFSNSQIFGRIMVSEKNHGPVRFSSCGLFGAADPKTPPDQEVVRIEGHGRVSFDNCHFYAIDGRTATPVFIRQVRGRLNVNNSVYIVNPYLDPIPLVIEPGAITTVYAQNEHYTTKRPVNRKGRSGRVILRDNVYADTR